MYRIKSFSGSALSLYSEINRFFEFKDLIEAPIISTEHQGTHNDILVIVAYKEATK